MNTKIIDQYNDFSNIYSDNINYDEQSNNLFYQTIDFSLTDKKILDIGCGDGTDLSNFKKQGAIVYGVDPSKEFVYSAKKNNPTGIIKQGVAEKIPFDNSIFDIVVSKWALQTSDNVPESLSEMGRVLKKDGILVILSKHPMQQYFGKIREYGNKSNYFEKKISTLHIFNNKITLKEPTHTFNEYLNKDFFSKFELIDFKESFDFPASEQFNNGIYPTYFIIKARKK
jgi:ubiquinone/menaquinone biosynthesis C-methylase UbiE